MNIDDYAAHIGKLVSDLYVEQDNNLGPMFFLIDADGKDRYLTVPPFVDKDTAAAVIRGILRKLGATRVAFVDEAWGVKGMTADLDRERERLMRDGVRDEPGRVEVIMVSVEDKTEGALMYHIPINRDGDKVTLGEPVSYRFDYSEGRIVGLLPKDDA